MAYINLDSIEEKEIFPGLNVKLIHTNNMTLAYWRIVKGAELPMHSHHHEQVGTMQEGELRMEIGGEVFNLKPGDVVTIPPNVPHNGKAITDCRIIDVFHPMREDYIK